MNTPKLRGSPHLHNRLKDDFWVVERMIFAEQPSSIPLFGQLGGQDGGPVPLGKEVERGPVGQAQLGAAGGLVAFDGALCRVELAGDLPGSQSLGHQGQHLQLTVGKQGQLVGRIVVSTSWAGAPPARRQMKKGTTVFLQFLLG